MNELIMAALTLLGPPALIGFLSILAAFTKNESHNKAIQMLLNIINIGGMNVGNAKNREDDEPLPPPLSNAEIRALMDNAGLASGPMWDMHKAKNEEQP